MSVQGKFEHLGLQVEEEEVMKSLASVWELLVAKIHGESQGYQEHFGAGREDSLVYDGLSIQLKNPS